MITEKGKLLHWAAQLEWFDSTRWSWIARFDTSGGKAHRDRNLIAHHETVSLPHDSAQALEAAKRDLRDHASEYTEAYLAARRKT
jgi:hypothetical protein